MGRPRPIRLVRLGPLDRRPRYRRSSRLRSDCQQFGGWQAARNLVRSLGLPTPARTSTRTSSWTTPRSKRRWRPCIPLAASSSSRTLAVSRLEATCCCYRMRAVFICYIMRPRFMIPIPTTKYITRKCSRCGCVISTLVIFRLPPSALCVLSCGHCTALQRSHCGLASGYPAFTRSSSVPASETYPVPLGAYIAAMYIIPLGVPTPSWFVHQCVTQRHCASSVLQLDISPRVPKPANASSFLDR
jgi:hypothetical protein